MNKKFLSKYVRLCHEESFHQNFIEEMDLGEKMLAGGENKYVLNKNNRLSIWIIKVSFKLFMWFLGLQSSIISIFELN